MGWTDYRNAVVFDFKNPLASFTKSIHHGPDANHDVKWNDDLTLNIPLWPDFVGRSRWQPGDFWKKQNYFLCAVELILEGDMEIVENGQSTIVSAGQLYILHCGKDSLMQTGPSGYCYKIAVGFRGTLLFPLLVSSGLLEKNAYGPVNVDAVYSRIQTIERLLAEHDERDISKICAQSVELFIFLRCNEAVDYDRRMGEILLLMEANIPQKINIAKLAEAMKISLSTLNRMFRRHYGKSAERYWIDLKMQRAALHLTNSQLSIKEVAQRVGYTDQLHFSHCFKRFFGQSPLKYRKQYENNPSSLYSVIRTGANGSASPITEKDEPNDAP